MSYTGLLDACVIYPAPLRDFFCSWPLPISTRQGAADIHREWIEALLRHEPHRSRAALERTRDLMDAAFAGICTRAIV